jgi:hypothetical protein
VSKEFKNYELKSCPRPLASGRYRLVSNTVQVTGADGQSYYCYVSFSDKLVRAVGKLLRGVMVSSPAFLCVTVRLDGTYTVEANLFRAPLSGGILWSAPYVEGTPEWLKFIKVKQDGNSPKVARKGKGPSHSDPQRKSGDAP